MPKRRATSPRSLYHDLLDEMIDRCHAKGWHYRDEMTLLLVEWLERNGGLELPVELELRDPRTDP